MAVLQPLTKGTNNQQTISSTRVLPPLISIKPTVAEKESTKPVQRVLPQSKALASQPQQTIFTKTAPVIGKVLDFARGNEGLGASIGRAMQKFPTKIQDILPTPPKFISDFAKKEREFTASQPKGKEMLANREKYGKVADFLVNFPGGVIQSLGKSLETLSTTKGQKEFINNSKNLPKTLDEVKTHIKNKEWQKAIDTAFSNPAVPVWLDITSFIPIGAGVKLVKGSLNPVLRKTAQTIVKEGIEEVEKKAVIVKAPQIEKVVAKEAKLIKPVTVKDTDELLTFIDRQGFRTPEQVKKLKADIVKNGIKYPVELIEEADGTFTINDGTHRIQIAKDLGIKEVPVKVVQSKSMKPKVEEVGLSEARKTLYHGSSMADEIKKAGKFTNKTSGIKYDAPVYFSNSREGAEFYSRRERGGDVLSFDAGNLKIAKRKEAERILGRDPHDYFYLPVSNKNPAVLKLKAAGFDGTEYAKGFGKNKGIIETIVWNKEKLKLNRAGEIKPVAQQPKVKIKPKEVSVPREQLPVASKEGIEKASRLEARVTESLDKTPQEIKDQLGSTFNQMNKKENIAKASKYVTENPSEAMAVLRGVKEAPQGILKNSIYVAMENLSKGDAELARKLASLQSTRFGQELSILTEIDPNSPVKIMKDIVVIREEAFVKRYGGKKPKEIIDKTVNDIKSKVKVDKYDWNNFIQSLPTC